MEQNYANHRRFVASYHYVLALTTLAVLIGSLVNLYKSINSGDGLYSASLITVMAINLTIVFLLMRTFALKAQDRAIRAEENLRHFALTGQLLDGKLSMRQVIGLRFASDDEFLELAQRAAQENLSEDDIKRAIKSWRADNYRV